MTDAPTPAHDSPSPEPTPAQNSPDSPASDTHNSPEPVPDITSKGDSSQEGGSASEWFAQYIPYLRISIDRLAAERDAAQARISSLEGALAAVYADLPGGRNIQAIVEAALGDSDE